MTNLWKGCWMIQKAKREETTGILVVLPHLGLQCRFPLLFRFQFLQPVNIQDNVKVLQGRLGGQNCKEAQTGGVWKVLHANQAERGLSHQGHQDWLCCGF